MKTYIELEEGWASIQKEIIKMVNIIEGVPESPVDASIHATIYTMCTERDPFDYSKDLYQRHKGVYNDYLSFRVLPALQSKQHDAISLLQEFVKRWANHKVLVTKLCRYFDYLERYYIPRRQLPSLKDVGFNCFREIVYDKVKVRVKDAVIALINQEREGNEIGSLVKDVVEVFVEIGNEKGKDLDSVFKDLEMALLTAMAGKRLMGLRL